jgi:hypothetical protein
MQKAKVVGPQISPQIIYSIGGPSANVTLRGFAALSYFGTQHFYKSANAYRYLLFLFTNIAYTLPVML